jgi:hypothetical protein
MKPEILNAQLNAMFEDEYIQTLWTLWQTRDETGALRNTAVKGTDDGTKAATA